MSTETENYYQILGVPESASADEIKKKFRELAREFHPDKHPGDVESEAKFKKINQAYETLGNEKKREEYNHQLKYGFPGGRPVEAEDFFNIFFTKFSQTRRQANANPYLVGRTVLTFKQILEGVKNHPIEVVVPSPTPSPNPFFNNVKKVQKNIDIPPGYFGPNIFKITLNIDGKDQLVYLQIDIENTEGISEISNNGDLVSPLIISYAKAVVGSQMEISFFDGTSGKIKIPANCKPGSYLCVEGKGLPVADQSGKLIRGDLLFVISVEFPQKVSDTTRNLLKKILEEEEKEIKKNGKNK